MPQKLLRVKPHLTYAKLTKRYKTAPTNREQRYWQLIRLMAHPKKSFAVAVAAEAAGFCQRWARQLVHRYNNDGPNGFYDKRRDNEGQGALLTKSQKTKLKKAILKGVAPDGGLWSGRKVATFIAGQIGKEAPSETTGLNYLHTLGFTLQMPRPKHTQAASEAEQSAFKKSSKPKFARSNVVFQTEW